MNIEEYLEERGELVNSFLEEYLRSRRTRLPETLYDSITYSLEGGKRIRPILVMASAELLGRAPEGVLPTAAGVELFHTYSLIHDDLPAMDDDDWRRGKPSNHRIFGEAVAILTGDALIPMGFELIATEQLRLSEPERVLKVIRLVCEALGIEGMAGGQLLDLESYGTSELSFKEINRRKTGALLSVAAAAGATLEGGKEEQVKALAEFGDRLGLAYQMIDDLIDSAEGEEEHSFPSLAGGESAKEEAERFTIEALKPLSIFGKRAERFEQLAAHLLIREQ